MQWIDIRRATLVEETFNNNKTTKNYSEKSKIQLFMMSEAFFCHFILINSSEIAFNF